eukprot:1786532-Pyramimonas_sp.AAC.1
MVVCQKGVGGLPERSRLFDQSEQRHDPVDARHEEAGGEAHELRLPGAVERVDGVCVAGSKKPPPSSFARITRASAPPTVM